MNTHRFSSIIVSLLCLLGPIASPLAAVVASYDAAIDPDPVTQGWTDSGGHAVTVGALSPDGATGANAWFVDDQTKKGSRHYSHALTTEQHADAEENGWRLDVTMRIDPAVEGSPAIQFQYGNGTSWRYLAFIDTSPDGSGGHKYVARIFEGSGTSTVELGLEEDGQYHVFSFHDADGSSTPDNAQFLVDGRAVKTVGPLGKGPINGIQWGSGSSAGTSRGHFHKVEFSVVPGSALKPAGVFSDHMVLQRDVPVPVWGKAQPGQTVTVSFAGQEKTTTADESGKWSVTLDSLGASAQSRDLTVTSGEDTQTLTDVLVGDVWLASGQSNMRWQLNQSSGGKEEIAAADLPLLRLLHMNNVNNPAGAKAWSQQQMNALADPAAYYSYTWEVCSPTTVPTMSAVAFFFARDLQPEIGVPVGLIENAVGGVPMEAWTRMADIDANPLFKGVAENFVDASMFSPWAKGRMFKHLGNWVDAGRPEPMPNHFFKPGFLFASGIEPLLPFPVKGVIWYQGETNADNYDINETALMAYQKEVFRTLIRSWRDAWGQPDLPFYYVQLPRMNRDTWPMFREMQLEAWREIPNTGMAVSMEYGHPTNVHPKNKEPVGHRLSLLARGLTYGQDIVYSGPVYRSHRVSGNKVEVEFDHVGGGLVATEGEALRHFDIAGADRKFVGAEAVIRGDRVIVHSPSVTDPVAVRYLWAPDPLKHASLNFYNRDGLPASPFRTDRWITDNYPIRVACVGDSITAGLKSSDPATASYPARLRELAGSDFDVRRFGKSGATVLRDPVKSWKRGFVNQSEHADAMAFQPDVVICNLGINDVSDFAWDLFPDGAGQDEAFTEAFVRDYKEIIDAYRALPTDPRIIIWHKLAPLFPGQRYHGSPRFDVIMKALRRVADVTGCDTLDMYEVFQPAAANAKYFPDHIHPNDAGYGIIARQTAEKLLRLERGAATHP